MSLSSHMSLSLSLHTCLSRLRTHLSLFCPSAQSRSRLTLICSVSATNDSFFALFHLMACLCVCASRHCVNRVPEDTVYMGRDLKTKSYTRVLTPLDASLPHLETSCPYTATHCNTLQHTATHCNTLQHTATHCNILQRTATHCNTLQHTAAHCNILQHTATHCNILRRRLVWEVWCGVVWCGVV